MNRQQKECIVSINDQTFEDWVKYQKEFDTAQCKELLGIYTEWQQLNKEHDALEYDYLTRTDTSKNIKKRNRED
jgi:hypothetical protein